MKSISVPLKQMIQRKQKHYKSAIEDYLITLHKALDGDTKQRLQQLSQRSITITVPEEEEEKEDEEEEIDDENDTSTITTRTLNGFKVAHLPNSKLEERIVLIDTMSKQQVAKGSIVGICQNGTDKSGEVKIRLDRAIEISIRNNSNRRDDDDDQEVDSSLSSNVSSVFRIKFDKQDILDRRRKIELAMRKFQQVSCSLAIHKCLLGNYQDFTNNKFNKSRAINLSESLSLKGAQLKAVEQSMRKRISLIEGVAGSGKTLVAASLAYSMCRFRSKRILLCSPIQATVDKLAQMLNDAEMGQVRVVKLEANDRLNDNLVKSTRSASLSLSSSSSSRNRSNQGDEEEEDNCCALDSLIRLEIYRKSWQRLERLLPLREVANSQRAQRIHHLNKRANNLVNNSSAWLRKRIEQQILNKADIVCCTLIQAGSLKLKSLNFDMLIIDDLQAAPETDCMIPMMVRGLKQVTLISEMRREIRSARSKRQSLADAFKQQQQQQLQPELANGHQKAHKKNGNIHREVSISRNNKKINNSTKAAQIELKAVNRELVVRQAQEPGGLFERLLSMGISAIALRNQFRMHETLAAFSNHHFYLSRLRTDKNTNKELTRQICDDLELNQDKFNWLPNSRCLTAFFDTSSSSSSSSLANKEVETSTKSTNQGNVNGNPIDETVKNIINRLIHDEKVLKTRIGIIINENCDASKSNFDGIDVGTVGDFLGQERDFMIIVAKRNSFDNNDYINQNGLSNGFIINQENNIKSSATRGVDYNYLRDEDALLIAITRARLGLFIVAEIMPEDTTEPCVKDDYSSKQQQQQQQDKTVGSNISHDYCDSWKALVRYYIANKLVIQA